MLTSPDGRAFTDLRAALTAARCGDLGEGPVTLKREGYTDYIIAKGGPAGWHVTKMGKKARPS